MERVMLYIIGVLAGHVASCPPGRGRPCPDPLFKSLFGPVIGVIGVIGYVFLFLGKRAIEPCDLIAAGLIAYLFSHFIWTLFFTKKEA
jgi:hypothetical protein